MPLLTPTVRPRSSALTIRLRSTAISPGCGTLARPELVLHTAPATASPGSATVRRHPGFRMSCAHLEQSPTMAVRESESRAPTAIEPEGPFDHLIAGSEPPRPARR